MNITKKFKKIEACARTCRNTLALSDLHLGRVTTHAHAPEIISPLVEGFERVLLLGDIVDHWYTSADEARNFEERIRTVCKKAGVKDVIYFRGNHDATMEEGEEFALFDGVLYLHGHAVYHKLKGDGCVETRIQALNEKKFGATRQASRANHGMWKIIDRMYGKIPMAMMNPFAWPWPVVRRIKALAEEVAPSGTVHGVVLGHSHRPGVRNYRGMTLFNLGGWMKNTRAYGFVRHGSRIQLIHINNRAHRLHWGKVLHECEFE
jgi:predicted phosphodiesterase